MSPTHPEPTERRSWSLRLVDDDHLLVASLILFFLRVPELLEPAIGFNLRVPILAALGSQVLLRWRRGRRPGPGSLPVALVAAAWTLSYTLSWLRAGTPANGTEETVVLLLSATAATLVVATIDTRTGARKALLALLVAGGAMAAVTAFQVLTDTLERSYLGFGQVYWPERGDLTPRIQGPIGDPNYYAQLLLVAAALALERTWNATSARAVVLAASALFATVFSVLHTNSRGGLVALLAVAVLAAGLALVWRPDGKRMALSLAVPLVALALSPNVFARLASLQVLFDAGRVEAAEPAAATTAAAKEGLRSSRSESAGQQPGDRSGGEADERRRRARRRDREDPSQRPPTEPPRLREPRGELLDEKSLGARALQMITAWEMAREHPWTGVGPGRFAGLHPEYAARRGVVVGRQMCHSLYMETAAEQGTVGLLVLAATLGAIATTLYRSARSRRLDPASDGRRIGGLALGLSGYFVAAAFLGLAYRTHFWLLIAVALAVPAALTATAVATARNGDRG